MFYRFRYNIRRAFRCAWRELKEEAIYAAREARLFQLAIAGPYERQQALHWLNTAIDAGRAELEREPDSNVSGPNVEHGETGSRATRPVQIARFPVRLLCIALNRKTSLRKFRRNLPGTLRGQFYIVYSRKKQPDRTRPLRHLRFPFADKW